MMQSHPEAGTGVGTPTPRWRPGVAWKLAAWQVAGFAVLIAAAAAAWSLLPTQTRWSFEERALGWLQTRQEARVEDEVAPPAQVFTLATLAEPRRSGTASAAAAPKSATAPGEPALTDQQAAVARWISLRYRVASEPIARIVHEAWAAGRRAGLDPLLILAVMAVESRFNPFSQSPMGAEGLMQVVTRVHSDKFEAFGGDHAAFDPISNLRVGVQVLKESISRAGGSLEEGLRLYVGATSISAEGYMRKVMGEREFLQRVKLGGRVPLNANALAQTPATPPAPAPRQDEEGDVTASGPTIVAADRRAAWAPASPR